MSGVAIITQLLVTNADLLAGMGIASADGRIMAGGYLPQGTTMPAILVEQISSVPLNYIGINDPAKQHTDRVQVTVLFKDTDGSPAGAGYPGVKALLALVLAACPTQYDLVAGVTCQSIVPDLEQVGAADEGTDLISGSRDFLVCWNAVVVATAPGAPIIGTAAGGDTQATVTFTAPASNGGAPIMGYTVTSSPAGGTDANSGSVALSHSITGLTNGTPYTFTVTAINNVGTSAASAASNSVIPSAGGVDPDVSAFLAATAITNPTITGAVTTLVASLKSAGLWTKLRAIYPMVGGSAAAHKWNLRDARDLDAAFRLTFAGTWTHSATGALPGGGYADTHFVCNAQFTTSSGSLGLYSRTNNNAGLSYDMGASDGADTQAVIVIPRYSTNRFYGCFGTLAYPSQASTDGRGLFVTNRNGVVNTDQIKNGVGVAVPDAVSLPAYSVYLGSSNKGGTQAYPGAKEIAFAFMGDGLTSGESADLYTAVQAFQTALSRNV